ncbi:MAG: AAA family ATPase [Anaerolineales bacterium]|nr:AAA family ATPase [Anaerolineales bacterium]
MTTSTVSSPTNEEMAAFLKGMRDLILTETAAQRRQIHAQWAKPLPARVADGYAIENVRLVDIRPNGQIELACTRNQSRFRPGDILNLNRSNPFFQPNITVSLDEDEETRLIVSSDFPIEWDKAFQEREGWVLDIDFLDLSSYVIGALAQAGDSLVGRTRILPLLMGYSQARIDSVLYGRGLEMGEALGLNYTQSESLANAYAADRAFLVQGPPGTGKTRVLATLARALVSDGERVLVTAFTHRAINNALNALVKQEPDIPAIKVGQPARADDLQVKNYDTFHESPLAEMSGGYVMGATPFATQTKRLGGVEFDTVIFDEASQITLPLAVMGMLAGQKYIFFGDQKQLPPVLTTRFTGGAFRDSVFGALTDRGFDDMLTETYRLNTTLTEWPSRHFYEGMLVSTPVAANRRIDYPTPPTRLAHILDPDEPKVFWDLAHHGNRAYSRKEAYAVVDLITAVLETGFPANEIGVVAPYRAQGRLIRNLLREHVPDTAVRRHIITDTVERMQGQERDLIILTLTTSNPGFAAAIADFFFQPERLNVAVTRPRKKLIIVGSRHVLRAQSADPDLQATIDLLADLLESCTYFADHHDGTAQLWESEY